MSGTPVSGNQPGLQLSRYHSGLADKHLALEKTLDKRNVVESVRTISKALREFEEFSRSDRETFLLGGLTQTGSDQVVCEWIAAQYDHLASLARKIVPFELEKGAPDGALRAAAWILAITLIGHAGKWQKIAALRPATASRGRLHKLFVTATKAGIDACILDVVVDRRSVKTTIEAMYVRALLLDRFASGNLPPKRLEILDTWLLTWTGALSLSRSPVTDGLSLAIDTRNPTLGLVRYAPGDRADYFLGLRPLQRQLSRATNEFHRGVIFPDWGIGLTFRVEEHAAVIAFLEREFAIIENTGVLKSKRFASGGCPEVMVFFGFNDIYTRALQRQSTLLTTSSTEIDAAKAPADTMSATATRLAGLSDTGSFQRTYTGRQPVHLLDMSGQGLGLEMSHDQAALVEVDDLIAVRIDENKPCVLGIVARKSRAHQADLAVIGVKVLAKVPLRATLEMIDDQLARKSAKGIFVPGDAVHGYADSILVTDAIYKANPTLGAMIASGVFHFRLGRVRQTGPGWKLAAVEVSVAR